MAVDMIEENELGALSASRVGNDRCFVDEKSHSYLGFTGEEDFFNLFGSQKRKQSIAQVQKDAKAKWVFVDSQQQMDKVVKSREKLNNLNKIVYWGK